MDITLERILSLIPTNENGRFKRSAAAEFAEKIGVAPNLPAEWKAGRNSSYKNKIGTIAEAYNISAEWLLGQTDQKEKPVPNEGNELLSKYARLTPEQQKIIDAMIDQMAGHG